MHKISVEDGLLIHKKFIFYKAYSLAKKNYHDAEDIVSEATILALQDKGGWDSFHLSFQTWIKYHLLTARKIYLTGNRKESDASLMVSSEPTPAVEPSCDGGFKATIAFAEIQLMPHPNIALYRYMGYTNDEICEALDISDRQLGKMVKENLNHYSNSTGEKKRNNGGSASIDFEIFEGVIDYNAETGAMIWAVDRSHNAKKGNSVGTLNKKDGFTGFEYKGKSYKNHRVAWSIYKKVSAFGLIKHINGDKTDNRIENLEEKK